MNSTLPRLSLSQILFFPKNSVLTSFFSNSSLSSLALAFLLFAASAPAQSSVPSTPSAPPTFEQVHRLNEQGKFDEAPSALSEISKADPHAKNLNHEIGLTYYRKGDYPNAVNYLKQAMEENPSDAEAVQLTGLSLYLGGKPSEAIPYLEKVQSWYPSANVDAAYILGALSPQDRREYEDFLAGNPKRAAALTELAGLPAVRFTRPKRGIR